MQGFSYSSVSFLLFLHTGKYENPYHITSISVTLDLGISIIIRVETYNKAHYLTNNIVKSLEILVQLKLITQ